MRFGQNTEGTATSRLFIGIRPDAATQRFLDGLVDRCRQQLGRSGRIRWTSHGNRHLTLAFLGETSDELIPAIETELVAIAGRLPACRARIVSLHPFPKGRSPLLAAELLTNPELDRLHEECRQLCMRLGVTPEGAVYRPHFTLARSRRGFAHLDPLAVDFTLRLDNITLYRSHTAPGGSQYAPLLEVQLEGDQ